MAADSASELDLESDTSSVDGNLAFQGGAGRDCESRSSVGSSMLVDGGSGKPGGGSDDQQQQQLKRIESLQQETRVLRMEVDTYKLKCKQLQEDNRELRKASVSIQAKAEQEEEFISNTLLKKIDKLKKEKETLAMNYEQEEEYLTNDLSRKLTQLRQEKAHLEETLEREQEFQVNKLMRKIEKLESETMNKQITLEQLRREKIELENALEQEQESLVNRLWKRMEKLEAEKRMLQEKLNEPVSTPPSPSDALMLDATPPPPPVGLNASHNASLGLGPPPLGSPFAPLSRRERRHSSGSSGGSLHHPFAPPGLRPPPGSGGLRLSMPPPPEPDESAAISLQTAGNLTQHIQNLRNEVHRLRESLRVAQKEHTDKMAQYMQEEKQIREENLRLQRKLQLETERRENLCRHLSESESSLEMDEERHFHEMATGHPLPYPTSPALSTNSLPHPPVAHRSRTASSPIPYGAMSGLPPSGAAIGCTSRPMSPAGSLSTSVPKVGAGLFEASMTGFGGLTAPCFGSVGGASAPSVAPLTAPFVSTATTFGRCPNCGVALHGALSPGGGGLSAAPFASTPFGLSSTAPISGASPSGPSSRPTSAAGNESKFKEGVSGGAPTFANSPPVAFVKPQTKNPAPSSSSPERADPGGTTSSASLSIPVSAPIAISRPNDDLLVAAIDPQTPSGAEEPVKTQK